MSTNLKNPLLYSICLYSIYCFRSPLYLHYDLPVFAKAHIYIKGVNFIQLKLALPSRYKSITIYMMQHFIGNCAYKQQVLSNGLHFYALHIQTRFLN